MSRLCSPEIARRTLSSRVTFARAFLIILRVNTLVERYAQMRDTIRVRERALFVSPRIPSELELQARWFAGDFGKRFVSTSGDEIDIIQFGTWNREAGPDFRDA